MIRVTQMSEFTGYPDFNLKKNVKTAEQIKYARFKVYENCISSGKCTICMELKWQYYDGMNLYDLLTGVK